MIKLAVFDIDGTLISPETYELAQKTIDAIRSLKSKGIKTAIATGRHYSVVQTEIRALEFDYYIRCNGACLTDRTGQPLKVYFLTKEISEELKSVLLALRRRCRGWQGA